MGKGTINLGFNVNGFFFMREKEKRKEKGGGCKVTRRIYERL